MRGTIRTRLTLTYVALVGGFAIAMIVAIYLFLRYGPTYDFSTGTGTGAAPTLTPVPGATPAEPIVTGSALVVDSTADLLRTFLVGALIALAILGALAAAVGWLVTGRLLRPLHDIAAAARAAGSGHLDHRIARSGPEDELKDLSDTFDTMLARLERAFLAHQRFAANASHELRTPLATTQAVLDVALADPAAYDVRELAAKLRTVNRQSIDTVDALLDLADSAHVQVTGRTVDLARLVEQARSEVDAEAAAAGLRLEVDVPDCAVRADPVLLRQLVLNLVQNAVRHNLPGGAVTVTATRRPPGVTLRVVNTGRILPPDVMPLLTEPFYRAAGNTAPRSRGLGLALAAAIAAAHGADLTLSANPAGGLTAALTLPLAAP